MLRRGRMPEVAHAGALLRLRPRRRLIAGPVAVLSGIGRLCAIIGNSGRQFATSRSMTIGVRADHESDLRSVRHLFCLRPYVGEKGVVLRQIDRRDVLRLVLTSE